MKAKILFITVLFLSSISVFAQHIQMHYPFSRKGDLLMELNKPVEAKIAYLKALRHFDADGEIHLSLAATYLKANNIFKADRHLKLAVKNGTTLARLRNDTTIANYLRRTKDG